MFEWIDVKDEMPIKLVNVLAFFPQKDYGSKIEVSYNEGSGFSDSFKYGEATYWMPLPQPPTVDKKK